MTRLRSLLFVPGDRPERFEKAAKSGADSIILDLEDSVEASRKDFARDAVADYLRSPETHIARLVRINPVQHPDIRRDVSAALGADAWVTPKAEGAQTIAVLRGVADGALRPLLPIATETPKAMFTLGEYTEARSNLLGITWGAEDLPAAMGAAGSRRRDGAFTPPYELARSLTLFAAHAAEVAAIDTVFPDIGNPEGLASYAAQAAFDGFVGMMAIHPSQVSAINAAFTPSAELLAEAQAIVDAFDAHPERGAIQFNGRMLDKPHLKQARRILARA